MDGSTADTKPVLVFNATIVVLNQTPLVESDLIRKCPQNAQSHQEVQHVQTYFGSVAYVRAGSIHDHRRGGVRQHGTGVSTTTGLSQ